PVPDSAAGSLRAHGRRLPSPHRTVCEWTRTAPERFPARTAGEGGAGGEQRGAAGAFDAPAGGPAERAPSDLGKYETPGPMDPAFRHVGVAGFEPTTSSRTGGVRWPVGRPRKPPLTSSFVPVGSHRFRGSP